MAAETGKGVRRRNSEMFSDHLGSLKQAHHPHAFSPASNVCMISVLMVIGPTPPGTGV